MNNKGMKINTNVDHLICFCLCGALFCTLLSPEWITAEPGDRKNSEQLTQDLGKRRENSLFFTSNGFNTL